MAEQQLVVFTLGAERYGVEIMAVREIVTMQKVTPIPGAPPFMEGVTNLRGRVIPVVDLKHCLGLPLTQPGDEARIMVIDVASSMVGCVVDSVAEVLRITDEVISQPDETPGADSSYMKGIAKVGDGLVILMDLRQVLAREGVVEDVARPA